MSVPHIVPEDLYEKRSEDDASPFGHQLIDVRRPDEFEQGHAIGAISVPLQELSLDRLEAEGVSSDEEIYIICKSGQRSLLACRLLAEAGWRSGVNVTGGTLGWVRSGLPIHIPSEA